MFLCRIFLEFAVHPPHPPISVAVPACVYVCVPAASDLRLFSLQSFFIFFFIWRRVCVSMCVCGTYTTTTTTSASSWGLSSHAACETSTIVKGRRSRRRRYVDCLLLSSLRVGGGGGGRAAVFSVGAGTIVVRACVCVSVCASTV